MGVVSSYGTGIYRPGTSEAHVLVENKYARRNGTSVGVLAIHGHGSNATAFSPGGVGPGVLSWSLAEAGFTVLSIDAGGTSPWADDDEMTAISAGLAYLRGLNIAPGPVGLIGWSMGGCAALNWIKRNSASTLRAMLLAPATDLAWFHDTSSGKATYAPEIEADYGGSASWAANIVGHTPIGEPANYRGLPPIRIYHGDADATIPLSQSQAFVTAVNDPHLVLHTVAGADHVSVGSSISAQETVDFFRGYAAA